MENGNQTVLITGATAGIGLELAKCFARDHFKMIIVARDTNNLAKTANLLKQEGSPEVTVIAKDLSEPGSANSVYEEIREKGLKVNILVNNAGVGERGLFVDNDLEKELQIIHLNIVSVVELTKFFVKDMLAGDGGKILQLASVASYQPTPLFAVYAATKAFVLSFTDALIDELKSTNVELTALIPGPTDTEFFERAHMENTKAAQDDPEDPAVVAEVGYEALMKGKNHAVAPGMKKYIIMSSAMPNEGVAKMARKFMEEVDTKN